MDKLPIIFVCCDTDDLRNPENRWGGPVRMIQDKAFHGVLLISISDRPQCDERLDVRGAVNIRKSICRLLGAARFRMAVDSEAPADRSRIAQLLIGETEAEFAEIRLPSGMGESSYRWVGESLEPLRREGILTVCLDDRSVRPDSVTDNRDDQELREIVSGWLQDQHWESVLSFKGGSNRNQTEHRLEDPTICLLKAAFFLGGSTIPQRMFSSGMGKSGQSMFGFGWTR